MKVRLILPAAAAAALTLLVALAPACGGGDGGGSTLEEYVQEFQRIKDDAESQSDAVEARLDQEPASAEDALELFSAAIGSFVDIATGVAQDLNGIEPPSEVSALHDDLVAAWAEGVDALEQLQADVEGLESPEDFLTLVPQIEEDFGALDDKTEQVCLDLQDVADKNNIDIDLECGDEAAE